MFGRILKYFGLSLLGLVLIIAFAVLVIPSTVSQLAVEHVLDDMGVKHQGIDTLDLSVTSATVVLGPVTIGEGENPIRAERLELVLAPLEYFDDRARVTLMRLTGADIVVQRLPDGDVELGGMKLSELAGGEKEAEPEAAAAEPEDEGEPIAFGVDTLEIANSRVFLRDINGGEFELEVRELQLANLQSWDKDQAANLSWNALFNGIELKHQISMQLFSSPKVIEAEGHMRDLTAEKIARTTGEPLEQAVDGTVFSDSKYKVTLNDDGSFEAHSNGKVLIEGFGIDTPEGDKIGVPNIELSLDITSKGGGTEQRQVAGDISVSADVINVESGDGAKAMVANLAVGGTGLNVIDVSGQNDSILLSALQNQLSESGVASSKSMVKLLLDVVVEAAREIGSHDLQIEGHPTISVGEVSTLLPGANPGDPPMLEASLEKGSLSVEDLAAGAIDGVWKIAGSAVAQLAGYRSQAALDGQSVASELGSADLKLTEVNVETDGADSKAELGVDVTLQRLVSSSDRNQQFSIGQLKLTSPRMSAAGGGDVEERAFGEVSLAVQDIAGVWPDQGGNLTVAGGALRVTLGDLDLQRLESSGGGDVLLEDWQVTQAGTKLLAGFKALTVDVPSVRIATEGDAITVGPGNIADAADTGDDSKADAANSADNPTETEAKSEADAPPKPETAKEDSDVDPTPARLVAGIPVPPARPAEVPVKAAPVVTAVAEVPKLASDGVFSVKLDGFHARAPVGEGLAEVTGAQTRLALNSFGLSSGSGGEANIGGALGFSGWRFADSAIGIEAGFKGLRARTPGLKAVFGKGFKLNGAVDTVVEGVAANVPGDQGRKWDVMVNGVSAKLSTFEAAEGQITAQGDVTVGGVEANESGEDGHRVAVGGIKATKINHTPDRTELESLLIENLQAVLNKHLVAAGEGEPADKEETPPASDESTDGGVAPLRIGTFSISPGSSVSLANTAGGSAVITEILVDKAVVSPVDLSNKATKSDVDVELRVNKSGKVSVKGNLPPLDPESGLDVKVRASGIQTKGFSPYTKEAVGVGLAGGVAAAAIDANGDPNSLKGNANIVLKQMEIEPMTDAQKKAFTDQYTFSPEYILDILSDSDGVIDLNVPISGTTKDPDFDISGIAVKAMSGMAASALTSPFSTIGSVAGGAVGGAASVVGGAASSVGGLVTGNGGSGDSGKDAAPAGDTAGTAAAGTDAEKTAAEKAAAEKAAADKAAQEKAAKEALENSFDSLGDSLFGN